MEISYCQVTSSCALALIYLVNQAFYLVIKSNEIMVVNITDDSLDWCSKWIL